MKMRIMSIWLRPDGSFLRTPLMRSSVIVELELMTSEASVLMDAATTSTSTSAMSTGLRSEMSAGMIAS